MIYLTADTHFNHKHSCTLPSRSVYATPDEHDAVLLENINSLVGRGDELVIIGDFAFSKAQRFRTLIRARRCWFIRGNHDRYEDSIKAFGEAPWRRVMRILGTNVVLDHFPQAYWHNCHRGFYHAYGHTHARKEPILDAMIPERRSMDVGVDNAYRLLGEHRPFSAEEFFYLLKDRKGHDNPEPR